MKVKREYIYRVLLLGEPFTGKEELCKKYISGIFQEDSKLMIGVDFYLKKITLKDKIIILQIFNLSWEERFRILLSSYCKGCSGAIIIYDIKNSNTLKFLSEWIQMIRENDGDIPIILIGNKLDLEISSEVSRQEGIKIVEKHNLSAFIEISTKTGENVESIFEILTEIMINKDILK